MRRKLDDLGRVVIPIELRRELGFGEPGALVEITKTGDGAVEVRAVRSDPMFTENQVIDLVARAAARATPDKQAELGAALGVELRRMAPEPDAHS